MTIEKTIFKQGSTTYYWSSKFFPKEVRADVFRLYSFVRLADDYVDIQPAKKSQFRALRRAWDKAIANPSFDSSVHDADSIDERVIKNIVYVTRTYAFDAAWVEAFWDSMQADLEGKKYKTLEDTLWYIHGSAEVIGLMMAKIMNLPPASYEAAEMQGRAMQFINFVRDIAEDNALGRQYFPKEDLARFGLEDLSEATAIANRAAFTKFMQFELARYDKWQAEAAKGLHYIPRRLRIPLKTASNMYGWTARSIERDPLIVFVHQVKPTKSQVLIRGFIDTLTA